MKLFLSKHKHFASKDILKLYKQNTYFFSSKFIDQENKLSKFPLFFKYKFKHYGMNIRIKPLNFELKTKFENDIDEIKADHMKKHHIT